MPRRSYFLWPLAVGLVALLWVMTRPQSAPLLLAPMIGWLDPCHVDTSTQTDESGALGCATQPPSAAPVIERTLVALQPTRPDGPSPPPYELGYTLQVPLLKLFTRVEGHWIVRAEAVQAVAQTIQDTQRPVILYLFATHFGAGAPLEQDLAADPNNLAHTQTGPLGLDSYHGIPIYPWSVARTDNAITHYRREAIQSVADAVCALPPAVRTRIRGVTLLGEVHQLFPQFESGMGYTAPYFITDYSPASVAGFQAYLRHTFKTVDNINRNLGTQFDDFASIQPPSKDIRRDVLTHYTQHIDAHAAGYLAISGWTAANASKADGDVPSYEIEIYVDGKHHGLARSGLSRQDVKAQLPELPNADVGWHYHLDYRRLAVGRHQIDIMLKNREGRRTHLGRRHVSVMDRTQSTPTTHSPLALPASHPAVVRGHVDLPLDETALFHNPLVEHWHAFRAMQVVAYLRYFQDALGNTCLGDIPHYTHQVVPFVNPGWDSQRFAVERSLNPAPPLRLGVSLYGEAGYGRSFLDWLEDRGTQQPYGITEFHPLQAMQRDALGATLARHRQAGAQFVSFFMEPVYPAGAATPPEVRNPLSFAPDNSAHGSNVLYGAASELLKNR